MTPHVHLLSKFATLLGGVRDSPLSSNRYTETPEPAYTEECPPS